ncbi:MAG: YafY family protein [Pseudomonas sp.]|uniref:helix-turn-helix transcriptional regulator n=1 Tax=Pseudomonas sp. TaxID=306 RepID=UPI0033927A54
MHKADRLFQLVNLIRAHQPITAQQLAQRIGVSVRTIYRYVDDLSVSGIPLYGEAGVGYALHEKFELPPLTLSQDEIAALMLGVEMLSRSTGDALAGAAQTLLGKIGAALPPHSLDPRKATLRALDNQPLATDRRHWDLLHQAIQQRQAVDMVYLSLDEAHSQRRVFPLALFYWGDRWTLVSWCRLRVDYRNFRIDRIERLVLTDETQPMTAAFSLADYMRRHAEAWKLQNEQNVQNIAATTDSTLSAAPS